MKKKCNHTSFKLEGDFGADPFWCVDCGAMLLFEDFPISDCLKSKLETWIFHYGTWIDFDTDTVVENAIELEDQFNAEGMQLFQEVKQELGHDFPIIYVHSKSTTYYMRERSNVGYTLFAPTGVKHDYPHIDLENQQVTCIVTYEGKTYMTVRIDVKNDTVLIEGDVAELGELAMDKESYIDMFKHQAKDLVT